MPVYEEGDGFTNGKFITPPDYIFDDEDLYEDVVAHLTKARQEDKSKARAKNS